MGGNMTTQKIIDFVQYYNNYLQKQKSCKIFSHFLRLYLFEVLFLRLKKIVWRTNTVKRETNSQTCTQNVMVAGPKRPRDLLSQPQETTQPVVRVWNE